MQGSVSQNGRPALLFCVCRIWCCARVDNGIGMLGLVFVGVDALRAMFPSFVSVDSAMLVLRWYMLCVSLWNFLFFYVNMWISDPEVDS